jgi:hypothetical protein
VSKKKIDIDYADVLQWLYNKDEDAVVHKDSSDICATCLFANYLQDTYNNPNARIGYHTVEFDNTDDPHWVPQWVTRAVIALDDIGIACDKITAKQAMGILENLEDKGGQ